MVRRYGLRDEPWKKIQDLLPGRADTVGVTAKDNRLLKVWSVVRVPGVADAARGCLKRRGGWSCARAKNQ